MDSSFNPVNENPKPPRPMSSKITGYAGEDIWRLCEPANVLQLPLESELVGFSDSSSQDYSVNIFPKIEETFKENGLEKPKDLVCFHKRRLYEKNAEWHPTIEIASTVQLRDRWPDMIKKIRAILIEIGRTDIVIEIQDRNYSRRTTEAVDAEEPICGKWPNLNPEIERLLDGRDWNALEVFRRGPREVRANPIESKHRVTILISAGKEGTAKDWQDVAEAVHKLCIQANLEEVDVEVSRVSWAFGTLTTKITYCPLLKVVRDEIIRYAGVVNSGDDIGYGDSARGTIGGYISLDGPDGSEIYGLTCAHVVSKNGELPSNPSNSTGSADMNPSIRIFSPSIISRHKQMEDSRESIRGSEDRIRDIRETYRQHEFLPRSDEADLREEERSISQMKTETDEIIRELGTGDSHVGRVRYASGFRKSERVNCSIDWALISVEPHRIGRNRVPPVESVHSAVRKDYSPKTEFMTLRRKLKKCNPYVLSGARTGISMGRFSEIDSNVEFRDEGMTNRVGKTTETVFVPSKTYVRFSERGDSGAFVLDKSGRLCGMLLGGKLKNESVSYVTPMEVIFEDIENVTGRRVSLPDQEEEVLSQTRVSSIMI
ncbi:MAG: hypothetical protein M1837_002979 [Sclerophora amabilis]|nr:MAG: hypothetical protein M1837_002979 [Sclerophora amabilis]